MRVIHFSDLHIGVDLYGRPLPDCGWNSRIQDFLDALDYLVDFAIDNAVDAVIFAGDAYKSREPSQTHQREFAKRVRRLSDAGIAHFLLVGNHDLPNAEGKAHALEIFRTLGVPRIAIGDNAWFEANGLVPQVLETRAGPLQVAFLPWPQVGRMMASDPALGTLSIEQMHEEVERQLTSVIAAQADALDPAIPAILTCHVSINDFLVKDNPGSEQWMTVGSAPTLLLSNLQTRRFDYVALGHHHNHMQLEVSTPTFYAGSMQPVDFGEENQPKGFVVFDLDGTRSLGQRVVSFPRLERVPARRFLTIDIRPKEEDPTEEVCRRIAAADTDDAIVRVVIEMSRSQGSAFRQPEARRLLDKAHFIASFRIHFPEDQRTMMPAGQQPDAASPHDTLELYLQLKQTEDVQRARLLAAADDLILQVEGTRA
jgi:exonuclease SbcD